MPRKALAFITGFGTLLVLGAAYSRLLVPFLAKAITTGGKDAQDAYSTGRYTALFIIGLACYFSGRLSKRSEYKWAFLWTTAVVVGIWFVNHENPDFISHSALLPPDLGWRRPVQFSLYVFAGLLGAANARHNNKKHAHDEEAVDSAIELGDNGVDIAEEVFHHLHH